ncbi:MAG: AAA family ATPase [Rubrivivax sp.]|nr:AAA family ATPase [Rubrivivax sp.]
MPAPPGAGDLPTRRRLRALLDGLGQGLLQRDEAVHLALLAALAGEHVLLIGPPGTAKSALARRLHHAFADARYFERLLTRFSTPEELFGPLSLKALEHDRYERLTDGFLPTAGIAFLDEVFKANSAILNALLTLLNERLFDNGTERLAVPLVAVVGASNEVPADEALHAFYDRFLVRVPVAPVSDDAFAELLALDAAAAAPAITAPLARPERDAVARTAAGVALGEAFTTACTALRAWLAERKAPLSDRRWRQIVGLARTAAATEGRAQLDGLDLWLAPFVASAAPDEVGPLRAWFEDQVLALPGPAAPWLECAVEAFEKQLGLEQRMPAESAGGVDDSAGKLGLARTIGLGEGVAEQWGNDGAGAGMQRLVSERLEARLAKRWGEVHVQARVAQVAEIEAQVDEARAAALAASNALAAALAHRLWVPGSLARGWQARHHAALQLLESFAARLAAARAGFAGLPVDQAIESAAPEPVPLEPLQPLAPAKAAPAGEPVTA